MNQLKPTILDDIQVLLGALVLCGWIVAIAYLVML